MLSCCLAQQGLCTVINAWPPNAGSPVELPPELIPVSPTYLADDSTSCKCAATDFSQTEWADWADFDGNSSAEAAALTLVSLHIHDWYHTHTHIYVTALHCSAVAGAELGARV